MKRCWIEYTEEFSASPMTYWVHKGSGGEHWREADEVVPPMPRPVPGRGFALMHVEYSGFTFTFASLDELDVCLDVLSKKNLPTSSQLSAERGTGAGPNGHWISRLPARVTPWKYRAGATAYLREARRVLEQQLRAT